MNLNISILLAGLILIDQATAWAQTEAESLMQVNYEKLVSRADLNYDTPVNHGTEGMPIGNGRMGSLVWTTPEALHFQINRVDLFCMGNNSRSFPFGHTSYSSGCGYVDISLEDYGDGIFTGSAFNQHLSVYDGLTTVAGRGVTARALAWNDADVIAVEIDDQRENPAAVNIDLRMLRYSQEYMAGLNYELLTQHASVVQTGAHTALSRLDLRNGRIILVQEFREGDFYSASAVAIGVIGRESKASYHNESTVRLSVAPGRGKFTTLIASAASYNLREDVASLALKQLDAAEGRHFDELLDDNRSWWSNYWEKSFVQLHSADGLADEVEANYNYFLYIMASCSRGTYMPRFSGMLWGTDGDLRAWGSEYWWHNQGTYYNGLEPANRPGLLDPVFSTYSRNFESWARAARQQWGSQGIWIPETSYFDGLEDLPDGVAREMRKLYLGQEPWTNRSAGFMSYAEGKSGMDSRWNWWLLPDAREVNKNGDQGPFSWTSHILSSTAKIAYVYWLHYAYSLDEGWLRTNAYPVIKGAAEFYRNFPNLYKAADGKYHIRYVSNHERDWASTDTPEELLAMHEIFPLAIRASEILDADANLRPLWKNVLDHLAPIPPSLEPAEFYDLCNVGMDDQALRRNVLKAFSQHYTNGIYGLSEMTNGSTLSRMPVFACNFGWTEAVRHMLPAFVQTSKQEQRLDYAGLGEWDVGVLRNRLALDEGPGAIECERLGMLSQTLHLALLQSVPPSPEKPPVNHLFPAWPREWDARFTLAARDAFIISASLQNGRIEFVEIHSRKGGICRVQNPWNHASLSLYQNGKTAETISGPLLVIHTTPGETVTMVPKGQPLPEKVFVE
jgi:hypothetical protein